MNFEKYSRQQFESRGLDSNTARTLADELQDDVTSEIQAAVLTAFLNVIEGLNARGHKLKPYGEILAGDISFRDEPVEGQCSLRLNCDFVISAGYAHTMTAEAMEAEVMKGSS